MCSIKNAALCTGYRRARAFSTDRSKSSFTQSAVGSRCASALGSKAPLDFVTFASTSSKLLPIRLISKLLSEQRSTVVQIVERFTLSISRRFEMDFILQKNACIIKRSIVFSSTLIHFGRIKGRITQSFLSSSRVSSNFAKGEQDLNFF